MGAAKALTASARKSADWMKIFENISAGYRRVYL
jgi:hypothetical protein